jgi:hypothetical protein
LVNSIVQLLVFWYGTSPFEVPGLVPFNTQLALPLLHRPWPAVVFPIVPNDPTNNPAVLLVRGLVPLI